jgi:serine/threonine protein kinase
MARASDGATDLVGRVIGERIRLERVIGEGGMGTVYRARHVHTGHRLAVKVLHPYMMEDEEAIARFEREALAGSYIAHPNVASAMESGTLDDGSRYIVLEHLDGHDLRTELMAAPLPVSEALDIARQIASALSAVHALGIVHRDLKPENVMVLGGEDEPRRVKLLDFGIAKVPVHRLAPTLTGKAAEVLTRLGIAVGTPEYMAPEQAAGEEVDDRADLYALGVVLYEMLSGKRPFDAKRTAELRAAVLSGPAPPFEDRVPGLAIPSDVEALTLRLLERRRVDRFEDADETVRAIEHALAGQPDEERDHTTMNVPRSALTAAQSVRDPTPSRVKPRGALPVWLAMGGLLSVAAAVGVSLRYRSEADLLALEEAYAPSPPPSSAAPVVTASAAPEAVASAPPPPPSAVVSDRAGAAELDKALKAGPDALQELADRYPDDPRVTKELMMTFFTYPARKEDALRAALRHLTLVPEDASDANLHRFLLLAANGPPEVAERAVDLMANQLRSKRVKDLASPALRVAIELRDLPDICDRKDLIARAAEEGDARAIEYLRPLTANPKCRSFVPSKCYACGPQNGRAAERAISTIRERGG